MDVGIEDGRDEKLWKDMINNDLSGYDTEKKIRVFLNFLVAIHHRFSSDRQWIECGSKINDKLYGNLMIHSRCFYQLNYKYSMDSGNIKFNFKTTLNNTIIHDTIFVFHFSSTIISVESILFFYVIVIDDTIISNKIAKNYKKNEASNDII